MLNDRMKGITKMKKARFLVGAIALAVLAAIIVACTKEKEKKAARNSCEMVTVSKEDDMSAYLKQFKENARFRILMGFYFFLHMAENIISKFWILFYFFQHFLTEFSSVRIMIFLFIFIIHIIH